MFLTLNNVVCISYICGTYDNNTWYAIYTLLITIIHLSMLNS